MVVVVMFGSGVVDVGALTFAGATVVAVVVATGTAVVVTGAAVVGGGATVLDVVVVDPLEPAGVSNLT